MSPCCADTTTQIYDQDPMGSERASRHVGTTDRSRNPPHVADTPGLRAKAIPIPLTKRQREIIALAATGLSNREIAERLAMSVRTVEGHLFCASQKTGVNSREGLIALLVSGPAARH